MYSTGGVFPNEHALRLACECCPRQHGGDAPRVFGVAVLAANGIRP
jgi:hypothetical protein